MEFTADPLGGLPATFNLIEALRNGPLTDCEVPLAVIYSTLSSDIVFVDNWSAP